MPPDLKQKNVPGATVNYMYTTILTMISDNAAKLLLISGTHAAPDSRTFLAAIVKKAAVVNDSQ